MARNEGPYIADWALHHIFFGFGPLIIVLHDCTDATRTIAEKLSISHDVHILDIKDAIRHHPNARSMQVAAYCEGIGVARRKSASHALLCDVDEFWTPTDFETPVQRVIQNIGPGSVIAFQWRNKWEDRTPFSRPFQPENQLVPNGHVKSIFPVDLSLDWVGVHSVGIENAEYIMSNGEAQDNPGHAKQQIIGRERKDVDSRAFIMHRYWRSELEYIVGLARGLRQANNPGNALDMRPEQVELRTNRWGYLPGGKAEKLVLPATALQKYESWISEATTHSEILELVASEQEKLQKKYHPVKKVIQGWVNDDKYAVYLADSLRGLSGPDFVAAQSIASKVASVTEGRN